MPDTDLDRLEEFYPQRTGGSDRPWVASLLRPDRPVVNVILFLLTCASTFYLGYSTHRSIADGLWYSAGIITILLCHEMGHYLMCLRHGVRATLPFFIPFPVLSPFGTLGAVIRMDSRLPDRRALFDIGVAGPLAGLAVTIPAIYFGLKMSRVDVIPEVGMMSLGESILFKWLSFLAKGPLPDGRDIILHPLAYAGWAGLFVTALNLLPIGQLDGGHILYALLGERSEPVYRIALALFALMGIILFPSFPGWFPFILLLLWFGYRHPPTMDYFTPLDSKRRMIAYLAFVIFILSFTPIPFYI
ncbi:MAG: site-2 protease family protein [candidate division KSB1 bacterium]|nr:site-2 protease family protein [candidate division KSB1 bacterium]MDZ7301324.1 site-2 protease family protein [candidate division KSB1 bacterium]MDZ7310791.1 site-2 protease family protein [candidate division KSB1 bacterium]